MPSVASHRAERDDKYGEDLWKSVSYKSRDDLEIVIVKLETFKQETAQWPFAAVKFFNAACRN